MNAKKMMKAAYLTKYGSPEFIEIKEVKKPEPKNDEVLIKVHAASATRADTMMRTGKPYFGRLFIGLRRPKQPILGTSVAGVVEEIGKDVTLYNVGDRVFGEVLFGCGTNAEYTCASETGILTIIPENSSFEEAAAIPDGAITSMNFLKNVGKLKKGQRVLINGASGSLGTAAIQLAKHYGAEVTAVCSERNAELVKSLGADKVINYHSERFTDNANSYDIVYDTVGKSSYNDSCKSLTKYGKYLSPVLNAKLLKDMLCSSIFSKKKAKFSATGVQPEKELKAHLEELRDLMESNDIKVVIDKTFSLEEIRDAHKYIDQGHKRGNIVLMVN